MTLTCKYSDGNTITQKLTDLECTEIKLCMDSRDVVKRSFPQKNDDFEFVRKFARSVDFGVEIWAEQLKAVWTAFCLRWDVIVDTGEYDLMISKIHTALTESQTAGKDCPEFDEFDSYMCGLLV